MSAMSLGDMSQSQGLRWHNANLKVKLQKLNRELATGQAIDLSEHLGGSFSQLSELKREVKLLDAYAINLSEAKLMTGAMQTRLENIASLAGDFSANLVTAGASGILATQDNLVAEAKLHFGSIVSDLNGRTTGRALFAGSATGGNALLDADTIIAELEGLISGAQTSGEIEDRIDQWFLDPNGFEAFSYIGGDEALSGMKFSENATLNLDVRANSHELAGSLKGFAKVIASGQEGLEPSEKEKLRSSAATDLKESELEVISIQSGVGLAQEQIEKWSTRNETERVSLEYNIGSILQVDPYETATELEAAQFNLESLYTVTVRMSRLSLVNYLR